jgi:hypothetical protein
MFVEVPAGALHGALTGAGFALDAHERREEVFFRAHAKDPRYAVRVYTSLSLGARGARGCGRDAIRVVVTFDGPNGRRGVWKGKRVFRAGTVDAVVARMLERMRDGYAHINGILKHPSYRRAS